jgi:hypothetical protein
VTLPPSVGDPPSVLPQGPPEPPPDRGSGLEVTGSTLGLRVCDGIVHSLVGTPFPDAYLGWCVVTTMGLRSGVPIAFYASIVFIS